MLIFVRLYPYIIAGSVIGFRRWFLKFIWEAFALMDFVTCLKHFTLVYNYLGLFLLFGFGLKFLYSDWFPRSLFGFLFDLRGRSGELKNGICLKNVLGLVQLKILKEDDSEISNLIDKTQEKEEKSNIFTDSDEESEVEHNEYKDDESENTGEDGEFDVSTLKKLIKIERHKVNAARAELEKERVASATAAEEAMAMILRLQQEKSSIDLELSQYRRLAEEKQVHDQQVIQSLQWLVWSHESEGCILEHQLKSCRRKLNRFLKIDERDGFEETDEEALSSFNGEIEDSLENVLYSSLDFNLSPEKILV